MPDTVTKNFWINGYNGVWTIDHDDGSQYLPYRIRLFLLPLNIQSFNQYRDLLVGSDIGTTRAISWSSAAARTIWGTRNHATTTSLCFQATMTTRGSSGVLTRARPTITPSLPTNTMITTTVSLPMATFIVRAPLNTSLHLATCLVHISYEHIIMHLVYMCVGIPIW